MMKETFCMAWYIDENDECGYRAKIILFKDEGYSSRNKDGHHQPSRRQQYKKMDTCSDSMNRVSRELCSNYNYTNINQSKYLMRLRKGLLRSQTKIQEKTMDYLSRHGRYVFLQVIYPRN